MIEIRSSNLEPGTREAILACIENYVTIVIPANEHALRGLRSR